MSRRDFLKVGGMTLAGGLLTTLAYLYLINEASHPVIDRLTIPIKYLPASLEGFTIFQMTDIHLYPLTQPETVNRAVELANSLNPDITVLTGDYVWRELDAIHELAPILSGLNARHGVYLTLGNHDYWTDRSAALRSHPRRPDPLAMDRGSNPALLGEKIRDGALSGGRDVAVSASRCASTAHRK